MDIIRESVTCVFNPEQPYANSDANSLGNNFVLQRPISLDENKNYNIQLKHASLDLVGKLGPSKPYLLIRTSAAKGTFSYTKTILGFTINSTKYLALELDDRLLPPEIWLATQNKLLESFKSTTQSTMVRYQLIWTTSEATEFTICSNNNVIANNVDEMPNSDLPFTPISKARFITMDKTSRIISSFATPDVPTNVCANSDNCDLVGWSGPRAAIINVPFISHLQGTVISPDYDNTTRKGPTGYQFPATGWTTTPKARQTYSFNREFTICIDLKPHFATGGNPLTTSHTVLATNKGYLPQNAAYTLGGQGLGVLKISPQDFDSTTYARTLSTFSLAPTQCPATLTGFYVQFSIINPYHNYLPFQLTPKVGNWSSSNFLTLNRAKCKFMTISRRRTVSTPPTSLLLDGHPWTKLKLSNTLVFFCHTTFPGVNMFSIRVPRLKRFSGSSTGNSIIIHPVMQCFSCIFLWLGPILITLHLSGLLTRIRTKHYWRTFRNLLSVWPPDVGIAVIKIC